MTMGGALGADLELLAEVLPGVEPAIVNAINGNRAEEDDDG